MRLFWRFLAVLGGLLVLLIIAVAIAVWTIDVNDFIAPIQKRVKDATGRDLVIRGGIDFKLSLEPELVIDDVSLSNAEWGKSTQMLTAKRVEAQVKLLPLLQRRFEIVRFKLIDPVIALETDAAGKGNWEFSSAGGGAAAAPSTSVNAFAIGDLAIDHGTASFRDGESGKTTNITIDTLSLHARDAESPVSARFRGTVGDIALATWDRCRHWRSDAGRTRSASRARSTASRHRSRPRSGSKDTRSISTSCRSAPATARSQASSR